MTKAGGREPEGHSPHTSVAIATGVRSPPDDFFFLSLDTQERQADWLLRAYGPDGAVPVPVLLDYLRAELASRAMLPTIWA